VNLSRNTERGMTCQDLKDWTFTSLFRLRGEPIRTKGGLRLMVETDSGPKDLNCPKWVKVYSFMEEGRVVWQAAIPDIIAERAGLVKGGYVKGKSGLSLQRRETRQSREESRRVQSQSPAQGGGGSNLYESRFRNRVGKQT
jgi:hypothetical protein